MNTELQISAEFIASTERETFFESSSLEAEQYEEIVNYASYSSSITDAYEYSGRLNWSTNQLELVTEKNQEDNV